MNEPGSIEPCVWMEAGVLMYRVCDRGHDCEHCPLDAALRSTVAGIPPQTTARNLRFVECRLPGGTPRALKHLLRRFEHLPLDQDAWYIPGHLWLRSTDTNRRFDIGFDSLFSLLLPSDATFLAVRKHTDVDIGDPVGWIYSGDRAVSIIAPFPGTVTGGDSAPHRLECSNAAHCYSQPLLSMHIPDTADMLGAEAMAEVLADDVRSVYSFLLKRFSGFSMPDGPSLNDGECTVDTLEHYLGRPSHWSLLQEVCTSAAMS